MSPVIEDPPGAGLFAILKLHHVDDRPEAINSDHKG